MVPAIVKFTSSLTVATSWPSSIVSSVTIINRIAMLIISIYSVNSDSRAPIELLHRGLQNMSPRKPKQAP